MGIIDEVAEEFYARIRTVHVLVLAALDVDALCASKILQILFKSDDVQYTLVPVSGIGELRTAYSDYAGQIKTIVMLNCGGGINISEVLELEDDVRIFILDSHRPLHIDNVYNQDQVSIVVHEKEEFDFPEFDAVYGSDMSEEDDDYYSDEDDNDVPSNKKRKVEGSFERRKRKHLWKKKRQEILFKYSEFSYHGSSVSLILYQLALKLSRESNQIIWWSIIGLTEQFLYEKIDREKYVDHIHDLQPHVLRLNRSEDESLSVNTMKITFENELWLVLYRHWTFYDSLCHSDYIACRFKVWTMKGHNKLLELLADMGLPLAQAKQKFSAMDVHIRDKLKDWMIESARKFGLDDMTYGSFLAQIGYKHHLCASDMVYVLTVFLEDNVQSSGFLRGLDALTSGNMDRISEGLELAKQQQGAIVAQVRSFTDTHQVVCAGPFIYAYVEEGIPNSHWFSCPITLGKLARYLRETWTATNKKSIEFPFILCSPANSVTGRCLVVGVPPRIDDSHKSEFHNAFVMAAQRVQAQVVFDSFDGSVMELPLEDRGNFIDALSALSLV